MQRSYRYTTLAIAALFMLAGQACKKSVGTYSNAVIQTPYTLYYSDSLGALFNTNDGDTVKPLVFPTDGYISKSISTSGDNLIWIKKNLYLSTNNGSNFNVTYASNILNPAGFEQTMVLDVPDHGRIYVASLTGDLGIQFSEKHGEYNSWMNDTLFSVDVSRGKISSLTQLSDKSLIGMDVNTRRTFRKGGKMEKWSETSGPDDADDSNHTNLPSSGHYSLGHYNTTLVAIDHSGRNGALFSNNNGNTWTKYTGLPGGPLKCVSSPFDQVLLIGTDSFGVYRLQSGNNFVPSNNGLSDYTVVNGIAGKENIYKNSKSTSQRYIFLATNQGLYRSQDLGLNWVRVQKGNLISIY